MLSNFRLLSTDEEFLNAAALRTPWSCRMWDVGSLAVENICSKFSYVPPKNGDKTPYSAIFPDTGSRYCNIISYCEEILQFKTIDSTDVHSLWVPNLLDSGTYSFFNKGEQLLINFSFNKNVGICTQT